MRFSLRGPLRDVELVWASVARPSDRGKAIDPRKVSARLILRDARQDQRAALARALGSRDVERAVEDALRRGAVLALVEDRRKRVLELESPILPLGPESAPTSWIAIALVDQDGNPVAGEPYRVEDPAGRIFSGTTDASGKATIDGIDPGDCKVTFPRLEGKDWKKQ